MSNKKRLTLTLLAPISLSIFQFEWGQKGRKEGIQYFLVGATKRGWRHPKKGWKPVQEYSKLKLSPVNKGK